MTVGDMQSGMVMDVRQAPYAASIASLLVAMLVNTIAAHTHTHILRAE